MEKVHLNLIKSLKKKKKNDEDSSKEYVLEVDNEYSKDLHNLHNDLPF